MHAWKHFHAFLNAHPESNACLKSMVSGKVILCNVAPMNCIRQRAVRHINTRVCIYADVSFMHIPCMQMWPSVFDEVPYMHVSGAYHLHDGLCVDRHVNSGLAPNLSKMKLMVHTVL